MPEFDQPDDRTPVQRVGQLDEDRGEARTPPPNGHKPLTRLSAMDRLFEAVGEVTVRCGSREVTVAIQAVDLELVESLCRPYKPKPKIVVELDKGQRIRTIDLADERYQDALAAYNRLNSYVYVLCSLMCDIEDKRGKVVWSADNSIHDVEAGKEALKDMGLVDNQLVAILNAASNLTQVVEAQQVED